MSERTLTPRSLRVLLRTMAWLTACLMLAISVGAQPAVPLIEAERFDGAPIRDVKLLGLQRVDEQWIWNNLRTSRGAPFDHQLVLRDVRSLTRLGQFKQLQVSVLPFDDGSVEVFYEFREQPLIEDIQVVGNTVMGDAELIALTQIRARDPADDYAIDRGLRAIEAEYRSRGYYLVRVDYDKVELNSSGILFVRVREGPRVRVTDIRFDGNETYSDKVLRDELKTETAFLFLRKGEVDQDQIDRDVRTIADYYQERGFLKVRVGHDLRLSSNNREAIVTFLVDEGPQLRLRDVKFEGATVLAREQLLALLTIQPGDVVLRREIELSLETLRDAYGTMGYTDFDVQDDLRLDPSEPVADLEIRLREGERFLTGLVVVKGAYLTRERVIMRDVYVQPDRPLSQRDIDRTTRTLTRLNLFDNLRNPVKVTALEPDPAFPGYRDVLIEVEETNTASFNFGVAVSTDSGLVGQIGLTQRNFDVTDTPDSFSEWASGRAFRGGGQTFSISLSPGQDVSNYSVSLSDPRVFDSDYSASVSGFIRSRFYSDYDEERWGGRVSVGRRVGQRWNGFISARWENVDISDVDRSAPVDLFEVEGENVISSLGVRLVRTSYDVPTFPSKGMRIELEAERYGLLGGDYNFTKLEASHRIFIPVMEDILGRKTVVSFQTRVGYIPEENEAPIFERLYLGGRTLRGFDFRGVGPLGVKQNGNLSDVHVGGRFLFKFSPELRFPLVGESIYGVTFMEVGTIANEVEFDEMRVAAGFGIRIRVPMFGPVPLAFDFAFPILEEDGDDTRVFSFDIALPFD